MSFANPEQHQFPAATRVRSVRRRWLQFSLRGSLLLLTALCIGLGWQVSRAHRQRDVVAMIETFGGSAAYNSNVAYARDYQMHGPRGPAFLHALLGEDYLADVVSVNLTGLASNVDDSDLARLTCLDELRQISVSSLEVSDEGLANIGSLKNLVLLDLSGCDGISGAGLAHLSRQDNLEYVSLMSTGIRDDELHHLSRLPLLRRLSLGYSRVTDRGLVQLAELPRLELLDLSGTETGDDGLEHLGGMIRLKSLCLGSTQVTDAGLSQLSTLINLEHLDLSNTAITDAGLAHLAGLTKLRSLNLTGTSVTDSGVATLAHLPCHNGPLPHVDTVTADLLEDLRSSRFRLIGRR